MTLPCPVPSRWVLDALAADAVEDALAVAERELAEAWTALDDAVPDDAGWALSDRNALRAAVS